MHESAALKLALQPDVLASAWYCSQPAIASLRLMTLLLLESTSAQLLL
jgi:hypothetical protein